MTFEQRLGIPNYLRKQTRLKLGEERPTSRERDPKVQSSELGMSLIYLRKSKYDGKRAKDSHGQSQGSDHMGPPGPAKDFVFIPRSGKKKCHAVDKF